MFADLKPALGEVDGNPPRQGRRQPHHAAQESPTAGPWWNASIPADAARVRELALGLASLEVVERKTSDPANYAKLGVEAPDTPTAASTLVEVVAGKKTWSLIVGKGADGRAVYVRKPAEAAQRAGAAVHRAPIRIRSAGSTGC